MPVTIALNDGLQCRGSYPEFQTSSTIFVPIVKSDACPLVIQQTLTGANPATGSLGNYEVLTIASNLIKFAVPPGRNQPFTGTITLYLNPPPPIAETATSQVDAVTPQLTMTQAGPYQDGEVTWPGASNDEGAPFNNQGIVQLTNFKNDFTS